MKSISIKKVLKSIILFSSIITLLQPVLAKEQVKEYCYSSYHLRQNINLSVKFGDNKQNQKTSINLIIHSKEVTTPNHFVLNLRDKDPVRSYIMMVSPHSNVNSLIKSNIEEKYRHPFMVHINKNTGELLAVESTETDKNIIDEYVTYYDLFQFSNNAGFYRYKNINGYYNSEIVKLDKENSFLKTNHGYINADDRINIQQSEVLIFLNDSQKDCFYYSSKGSEKTKTRLSKNAYVNASASFSIVSSRRLSLTKNHTFFSLSSQISEWPSFEETREINEEIASNELSVLMEQLALNINNKPEILRIMKSNKDLWPYLQAYISENEFDLKLIGKIFWALNVTDSTESVSALATIAVNARDNISYKAIMALISTSASLDEESLDLLKSKIVEMSQNGNYSGNSLLLVRAVGLLAKRRIAKDPYQSEDLKQFLYEQTRMSEGKLHASLLKSVGALGDNIDEDGIAILMNGLQNETNEIVQASLVALEKIPYDQQYSDQFVSQLKSEKNRKTKHRLIELLGNTSRSDNKVKQQLISLAGNSSNRNDRKLSLNSLKKVGYDFQADELKTLESQLRIESDKTNQKLLVSLILKARRNKINK